MIKIVYGNEPYLIEQIKSSLGKSLKNPDMNRLKAQAFSDEVYDFLTTYPILDDKRVVLLDIDTLSVLDNALFKSYLDKPSAFSDLLIEVRNYDARMKLANELKKQGLVKKCNKLENKEDLEVSILKIIAGLGGRITVDAYNELIQRENYLESDVNLFNILNDLKGILSISRDITKELVLAYVKDHAVEEPFSISKLLLRKDIAGLRRQINLISSDNAIQIISLLLREYRIAWKVQMGLPVSAKYVSMKSLSHAKVWCGLAICQNAVDSIKKGALPSDQALQITLLKLLHEAV